MRTTLAAVAVSLMASAAHAGTCGPVKEYAQYKDQARTAAGRDSLAGKYCLYRDLAPLQRYERDLAECRDGQGKILDALEAAGDKRRVAWALDGCKGDPPKK